MATSSQKAKLARESREVQFLAAWRAQWSNLYGVVVGDADYSMVKLSLHAREDGGLLFVLVGVGGTDGAEMVVFGSGQDFVGAMTSLNASISANKWRPNKRRSS